MKKILMLTAMGCILTLTQSAWASGPYPASMTNGTFGTAGTVTPNGSTGEIELFNAVNQLLGTNYTSNSEISSLQVTSSTSTWQQTGSGGYAVIGLGAGATNTLNVYNTNDPSHMLDPMGTGFSGNGTTGNGTLSSPYAGAGSPIPVGDTFGFDLNQSYKGVVTDWNSDSALNSDEMDHMVVYDLGSLAGSQIYIMDPTSGTETLVTLQHPYLIGFEDLSMEDDGLNSDMDYNDLMFLVDGAIPVSAVPEPMTYLLLFAGLIAIGALRVLKYTYA